MKKSCTARTPFRGRWHVLLIAALLIGGAVRAPAADDQPQIAPDVAVLERRVQSGTEALFAAAGAARAAEAPGRLTRGQALLQTAERREAAMLMESAPAALRNVLPARWRSRLPPEVRAHVEQAVTARGTLEVFCVLFRRAQPFMTSRGTSPSRRSTTWAARPTSLCATVWTNSGAFVSAGVH